MNICSRVRLVVVLGLASAATAAGAAAGPSVASAHCAPVAPPVCMPEDSVVVPALPGAPPVEIDIHRPPAPKPSPPSPPVVPLLSLQSTPVLEGATSAKVDFMLSTPTTATVSVRYATVDGTATAGRDYLAQTGVVTFGPGELYKEVDIALLGDSTPDGTERFSVHVSSLTGATPTNTDADVTVIDVAHAPVQSNASAATPTVITLPNTTSSAPTLPANVTPATLSAATSTHPATHINHRRHRRHHPRRHRHH